MIFPKKLPGLRAATILLAIYGLAWITMEGNLVRVILLAAGLSIIAVGYLVQGSMAGRYLPPGRWLLASALVGGLLGLVIAVFSLVLMGVKTGLHAHGPEFTPAELSWVIRQAPLWIGAGIFAGMGLGLLTIARYRQR